MVNERQYSTLESRKLTLLSLYTFSVYVGSAIYVPSERGVMEEFGVGETVASLGLALYVLTCIQSLAHACLVFADFLFVGLAQCYSLY